MNHRKILMRAWTLMRQYRVLWVFGFLFALAGGESGKVVAGKSSESELLKRLTSDNADLRMPPEGPRVPAEKIALRPATHAAVVELPSKVLLQNALVPHDPVGNAPAPAVVPLESQ